MLIESDYVLMKFYNGKRAKIPFLVVCKPVEAFLVAGVLLLFPVIA